MGSKFTGQNKVRCASATHVCEACVLVMSGKPPDTERMYSHFVEGDSWLRVNKGQKPKMREFLRRPKSAEWGAAIADSGKRHICPWTPMNAPHQPGGRVLFEEALVDLPRTAEGWALLDTIANALTDGATKDEILSGHWTPRAWQLLGAERVGAFEVRFGEPLRGGAWFELAIWLAQRDEAKVVERMTAEKAAREAKRGRKGKTRARANDDGGGDPRPTGGVPADVGVLAAEALGPARGPTARGRAAVRKPRGVGHVDDAVAPTVRAERGQLSLFP